MQLFVTDINPAVCARHLDDLRLNKIIVESAQLISTSHPELIHKPYKATHINHPLVVWISEDIENYYWTVDYFKALCCQRTKRFPERLIHKTAFRFENIKSGKWSLKEEDFYNCTPYKDIPTFEAYKRYLLDKWKTSKSRPTWGGDVKDDLAKIFSFPCLS